MGAHNLFNLRELGVCCCAPRPGRASPTTLVPRRTLTFAPVQLPPKSNHWQQRGQDFPTPDFTSQPSVPPLGSGSIFRQRGMSPCGGVGALYAPAVRVLNGKSFANTVPFGVHLPHRALGGLFVGLGEPGVGECKWGGHGCLTAGLGVSRAEPCVLRLPMFILGGWRKRS